MSPVDAPSAPAIMLVAGEASGDLHGAGACRALTALTPGVRLFGMGGPLMAAAGMTLLGDVRDAAVVGFTEVVRKLPALRRTYRRLREALLTERPAVLVLIDYPGMNVRLAGAAHRAGIPVVYFVPPQVWAWRAGRLRVLRRRVARVLAVFPFERPLYEAAGVPVEFVGHPILDMLAAAPDRSQARRRLGLAADDLVIGLLPGSRAQEIGGLLPMLREAAAGISAMHPAVRFVVALAPTVHVREVDDRLQGGPPMRVVQDLTHEVMRAADLLLVTSGTATLEAGVLGTPMVVCYRISWVTEMLARRVLRVPWISLVNIVLGRTVVPELYMRRDLSAARIAREALRLLETPAALQEQRDAFRELAGQLGDPGVGPRVARAILSVGTGAGHARASADLAGAAAGPNG